MSEYLERELANNNSLIRDLMDKVNKLEATRKTAGGIIVPQNVVPGPGNASISRQEFQKIHTALVNEIEGLKAELAKVADVAFEAVRILDRMAGMEDA